MLRYLPTQLNTQLKEMVLPREIRLKRLKRLISAKKLFEYVSLIVINRRIIENTSVEVNGSIKRV